MLATREDAMRKNEEGNKARNIRDGTYKTRTMIRMRSNLVRKTNVNMIKGK